MKLSGAISDRLRRLFSADDPAVQSGGRTAEVDMPKGHGNAPGVEGHSLGGRHRKEKKQ